jgi:hypothetical protein
VLLLGLCVSIVMAAEPVALDNGALRISLGYSENGAPIIREARWDDASDPIVSSTLASIELVPKDLAPSNGTFMGEPWRRSDSDLFVAGETSRELADGLILKTRVELAKKGGVVRFQHSIENHGAGLRAVEWFPIISDHWKAPGAKMIRGWRALSFAPIDKELSNVTSTVWGSRIHSSDSREAGMNPYWRARLKDSTVFFALEWCGGWKAEISGDENEFNYHVFLPPNETQLQLKPSENIAGPAMMISFVRETDEALARADWMRQRAALAKTLYGGPAPSFPFGYNNWYTTRFNVDGGFLKRQVACMAPYKFDAFIVDAGWYESVGHWTPDVNKFAPGEFTEILREVKAKGVIPGIWTCPQFINALQESLPPEADQPPTYEKFIQGYLLDLVGSDFPKTLPEHIAMLRKEYGAEWWKYDQILFTTETRSGVMRNVIAFHDALKNTRAKNQDLIIENCQSGGRMTNELTVLATQSQWLRDGGNTGLGHARDNVSVALGAMDFIFPWAANRWTNNPDQVDASDDELLSFYCRSAMPGTWGLVADLGKIGDRQRNIIIKEVANYRALSGVKKSYLYDVKLGEPGSDAAFIIFYGEDRKRASAIVYRWDSVNDFDVTIPIRLLDKGTPNFSVTDIDSGTVERSTRAFLIEQGFKIHFPSERRSAILNIAPAG